MPRRLSRCSSLTSVSSRNLASTTLTPTASESVVTMLAAWELFSDRLQNLSLPFIPEHGGKLPDYLSEVKWELDWMLKMPYADGSGRVSHKLNSANFPGFIPPSADKSK